MADVSHYVNHVVADDSILSSLDKELVRFFQLMDTLGSLSRYEKPLGPNFSATILDAASPSMGVVAPTNTSFTDRYDHLLSLMWQWAHWQQRFGAFGIKGNLVLT